MVLYLFCRLFFALRAKNDLQKGRNPRFKEVLHNSQFSIQRNTTLLLQQLLNGLAIGSLYAIFALGYTLIFSILRVINFTHGAIFALGAYATYLLTGAAVNQSGVLAGLFTMLFGTPALPFALPFLPALVLGASVAGFAGILVERIAFRPLRARGADPL